jgi:septal ring factor EnvC (AmiA/AmiB activator)
MTRKEVQAMSPAVGNFVHDLVEMAKAMETLPQVEAENARLHQALDQAQQTTQDRELAIISYKQQIDDLQAKVRSLEVERDDASFRVLEAEDTAHSILSQARATQDILAKMIEKLDPPKPQPEPVVEHVELPPSQEAIDYFHQNEAAKAQPTDASQQGQSESPSPTTSAPVDTPQPIASPTAPVASTVADNDVEPTKFDYYGNIRQSWWDWSDRQSKLRTA